MSDKIEGYWQILRDTFAGSSDPLIRERGAALVEFARSTVENLDRAMDLQKRTHDLAEVMYCELLLKK